MGKPKPSKHLWNEVFRLYEREPEGWRLYVSRDNRGFLNILVSHRDTSWLIKEEFLTPYEKVGLGVKVKRFEPKLPEPWPGFGFRPIPDEKLKETLEGRRSLHQLILELLDRRAEPLNKIKTLYALQGPIVHLKRGFEFEEKLEEELGLKLEKLVEKVRPQARGIYR